MKHLSLVLGISSLVVGSFLAVACASSDSGSGSGGGVYSGGSGGDSSNTGGSDNAGGSAAGKGGGAGKGTAGTGAGGSTAGTGGSAGVKEDSDALCSDGIDNNGDGKTDCADFECQTNPDVTVCAQGGAGTGGSGGSTGSGENTPELCSDGQDNDGNKYIDCNDKGCCGVVDCSSDPTSYCGKKGSGGAGGASGSGENTVALCSDGVDNDGNNYIDCNDKGCCSVVDCSSDPTSYCGKKGTGGAGGSTGSGENTVALCSDGVDNDGNNYIDCNDKGCCGVVDCSSDPTSYCGKKGAGGAGGASGGSENTVALCTDGIDNDGDKFIDCEDKNCCGVVTCDPATYCGKQGAGGSGAGGSSGGSENTVALCTDGIDNDGDKFIDCEDKNCCGVVTCDPATYCGKQGTGGAGGASGSGENTVALCSDGIDNDGNKYIDCDDKGCCGVVDCTSKPTSYCGKMGK
jgi:hypothetical protein